MKRDLSEHPEQVYQLALRYLARREHAKEEIRQKLLRKGATADAVDDFIQRLQSEGLLSDERYAAALVRQRRDYTRRGRKVVLAELHHWGVDRDIAESVVEEEYNAESEYAVIKELVKKALPAILSVEDSDLRRKRIVALQRRLLSRGFSPSMVYELVDEAVSKCREN